MCGFQVFLSLSEQIFYLVQVTGQLLVLLGQEASFPLVLLLVVGLKLFPFALAAGQKGKVKPRRFQTALRFFYIPNSQLQMLIPLIFQQWDFLQRSWGVGEGLPELPLYINAT